MDQQTIISQFEDRAKALGLAMTEVCRRASLHPTTFSRWKVSDRNPEPIGANLASLSKINAVLTDAETAARDDEEQAA